MYSLGPGLSDQVETSLESQITGMQDMTKNQVNQAIYIGTQSQIAKTDGALQNIRIAQEFLSTTLAALETVNNELINASKAILTLLNGVVSSSDKEAAADSILNTMGMIQGPTSRDAQEGSVIKTLRQAGTGQSPFYVLTTTEAAPPTPLAAPPEAPVSDDASGSSTSATLYLNGSGSVAANTFLDSTTVSFTGFSADVAGTLDPTTAIVTNVDGTPDALTDIQFEVMLGDVKLVSEVVDLTNAGNGLTLNMYNPDDRSQYVTFYTAPGTSALVDTATIDTNFKALFTGTVDTAAKEAAASGTFTTALTGVMTNTNTFGEPTTGAGPAFSGVEPGAIQVLSATGTTAQFVVSVGEHIYSTSMEDAYDLTSASPLLSQPANPVLYLNGDKSNSQTITLTLADLTATNGFNTTPATTTLAAFTEYMSGTYTASSGSTAAPGIFQHSGSASPTGAFMPCNAASFVGVDAGAISVESADWGADGSEAIISVKVGDATYATDPANTNNDVMTADTAVILYKDGDPAATSTITMYTGPIASVAATNGIVDSATLLAEVQFALDGTYNAFGQGGGSGPSTPFAFNPGSNFGAGYFTVNYDGKHLTVTDQFGTLVNSYPMDDRQVVDAANTTGEIKVGNIGTIYVDSSYTGGGFNAQLTTTPSDSFDAIVTVSASDGTRSISIPNLADQKILWGANDTIDRNLLISSVEYQQKVKGMIDHAAESVKDTIQYATNVLSVLNNDEEGQNATMESLHNLQDTVSAVDPVQAANAVFETTQSYLRMIQSMTITAQVIAQESASANQIAQLAVAGI
ncbi:MAG: hypothetical protein ACPGUZ_02225 [Holosporaceae bacterium]